MVRVKCHNELARRHRGTSWFTRKCTDVNVVNTHLTGAAVLAVLVHSPCERCKHAALRPI